MAQPSTRDTGSYSRVLPESWWGSSQPPSHTLTLLPLSWAQSSWIPSGNGSTPDPTTIWLPVRNISTLEPPVQLRAA